MPDLTERCIRSQKLADGVLLKAYRDEVQTPDGGTSIREWIDHPGAAAVVPLFEDGTTLLLRQFRYPPRRTFIEIPAGKLDQVGERPSDVALRELEEETGWRAETLHPLGSFYPCIGYSNEVIHIFLAEALSKGQRSLSDGEFLDVLHVSFNEAVAMARRGEILDMKSVAALLLADTFVAHRFREEGI